MKKMKFNTENYSQYTELTERFNESVQKIKASALSKTDVESLTIARKF